MEATLLICANAISVDQRSNTLSLFNILEEINSPSFPMVVPYMVLVAMLTRGADEPNVFADLTLSMDVDGEVFFQGNLNPADFQQKLSSRLVVDMQGLIVPKAGMMRVVMSRPENPIGLWKIRVNNIGPTIKVE